MSVPPPPGSSPEPLTPSRLARRCSGCSTPLEAMGPRPIRTGAPGFPEGALTLEMFWCSHCGKIEFYSQR